MQGLILDKKMYLQYSINIIKDANITAHLFGDLFKTKTPYFTIIDDYFIFGANIASLEYLIDNYNSDNTLANNQHFNNYSNNFLYEMTVIIGNDYNTLESFNEVSMYYEPF